MLYILRKKIRQFKDFIAYNICELAFWFDKRYCKNLSFKEEEWSNLDHIKHYIFRMLYLAGCHLYK